MHSVVASTAHSVLVCSFGLLPFSFSAFLLPQSKTFPKRSNDTKRTSINNYFDSTECLNENEEKIATAAIPFFNLLCCDFARTIVLIFSHEDRYKHSLQSHAVEAANWYALKGRERWENPRKQNTLRLCCACDYCVLAHKKANGIIAQQCACACVCVNRKHSELHAQQQP